MELRIGQTASVVNSHGASGYLEKRRSLRYPGKIALLLLAKTPAPPNAAPLNADAAPLNAEREFAV